MTGEGRLTLGGLYREMRHGLGDSGRVRVSVEFQQHSSQAAVLSGHRARPGVMSKRILGADLDYDDQVLQRAALHVRGMSTRPIASFTVQRYGSGYVYSVDDQNWGRFVTRPRIFDLAEFEAELGLVPVRDVTIEQAMEAQRINDALDIDLDAAAFDRLLGIFSADRDDEPEALSVGSFSVSIAGGEDVSMLYWWSLTGFERGELPADRGTATYASKVTCSVAVRLAPLDGIERRKVRFDRSLPEVAHIDEVWALARALGSVTGEHDPAG